MQPERKVNKSGRIKKTNLVHPCWREVKDHSRWVFLLTFRGQEFIALFV